MSSMCVAIVDSTDTRVGDVSEAGYVNIKLSSEAQALPCLPSSVRNFANGGGGALVHGLHSSVEGAAVFKDCNLLDASKHFYDRGSEFLKCNNVPWEEFVKVQRTDVAASDSLTTGAYKFIKDEKEPSGIMETPCPNFDPSPEIPALLGLGDPMFRPAATAAPRPVLDASPNFLMDLNQPEQLPALGQVRADSRCGSSGKTGISFDANIHAAAQQSMYKSEVARWPMPAEPQYWCQSSGVTDDPFTLGGYEGLQTQALTQRNHSPFPAFPG